MMEFEDQDDVHEEEEVEDEELEDEEAQPTSYDSSLPNSSTRPFKISIQTPAHGCGATAAAAHNEPRSSSPPPLPLSLSIPAGKKPAARYRECLKNHAVGICGHAVDGCGEFMPAGPEGSLDALKCAACNCHRNFHRKEVDPAAAQNNVNPVFQNHHYNQVQTPIAYYPHPHPISQFYPYKQRPLALPSTSGCGGGEVDDAEMISDPMGLGSSGKKRFRTKFTPEQKEKMRELAERIGWRLQKHDEAAVQRFCEETGVKRHVLKVWMHNNKHTLGKKP